MNQKDGNLYFKARIDTAQMERDANRLKGQIRGIAGTAQEESDRLTATFKSVAGAVGAVFSVQQAIRFVGALRDVRGMFQQIEIAFETMLGSADKANALMAQLMDTARKTPFEMGDVAQGAKQLLAYGVQAEEVNATLIKLGDIASGLSIPLGDLIYLYGTTLTQGRMYAMDLRQFMGRGIPMAEELAKQFGVTKDKVSELVSEGKIGAEEVKKAIDSLATGKFNNLMKKQAQSLTGQWSNLKDAIQQAMNKMGESTEGVMGKAIQGATELVENYKEVGRIIAELVVAFGAYKAAVIATGAVMHLVDFGSVGAKLAFATLQTQLLTKAQKLLNATILKNPYAIVGAAVAGLAVSFYRLATAETEAEKATRKVKEEVSQLGEKIEKQRTKAGQLVGIIQNEAETTLAKQKAFAELNKIYPGLLKNYDLETIATLKQVDAERKLNEERDKSRLREAQKYLDEKKKAYRQALSSKAVYTGDFRTDAILADNVSKKIERAKSEAIEAQNAFLQAQKEAVSATYVPKTEVKSGEPAEATATKAGEARKSWEEYARETTKAAREAEMQIREAAIKEAGDTLEAQIDQIHLDADRRREEIESSKDQWVKSFADFHRKQNATLEDLAPAQQEAYRKLLGIVDREELEAIRKTQDEALKEFYTFSQKRDALVKEWEAKRRNATEAGATAEQLKVLSEAEKEALDDLDSTFARRQDSFKSWLDDIAGAGFKELQTALARARLMLAEAEIDGNAEGIAVATEKIKETEAALKDFKAPAPSDRDADKWTDLHKTLTDIGREFDDIGAKMGGILGGIIGGLGKAVTQAGRLAVSFDKLGKAKTPTEKLTAGIGAVSAAVGVFSSLFDTFKGVQDALTRQETEARKFRMQAEALNDTLARTKRVAEDAGKALRIFSGDAYGDARRDVEAFTEAQRALGETIRQTVESATNYKDLDALIRGIGDDMVRGKASILDTGDALKNFAQVLANIQVKTGEKGWWLWKHDTTDALGNIVPELFKTDGTLDFDALGDFTKSDLFNQIPEQYQALFKKLEAEHDDYKESLKGVQDYLSSVFGSLGGDLMDGIIEAFRAGEDASKSFSDSVEKTLEKLVSDMIYSQVFSGMLKTAEGDLQSLMQAGASQTAYFDYFDQLMGKIEVGGAMAESLLKQARQAGRERGFDLFGGDAESGGRRTAQTKGLAQASQDSINELNGRATAIQEHTYLISENTKLLLNNTSAILTHVAGIHADTARLKAIETSTRATEAALTEIRDKGIKLK